MSPSSYDLMFISVDIVITVFNIALMFPLASRLRIIYKKFHYSYFVLRTLHIVSCFFITVLILPTSITILKNNELDFAKFPKMDYMLYRIGAIGMSSVSILLRFATIGIFIERSIATCYFSNYEYGSSFRFVGFWISLITLFCSGLMGAAYQARLYPFNFHVGAVVFLDCVCFLVLWLLVRLNKKMRKINNKSEIHLSQRYQINENLRILFSLQPMIAVESVLNIVASFSGPVALAIFGHTFYRDFAYYTLMNTNVFLIFLITIKTHPVSCRENIRNCRNTSTKNGIHLVNVLGKQINEIQSQQEYFRQLQKEWS